MFSSKKPNCKKMPNKILAKIAAKYSPKPKKPILTGIFSALLGALFASVAIIFGNPETGARNRQRAMQKAKKMHGKTKKAMQDSKEVLHSKVSGYKNQAELELRKFGENFHIEAEKLKNAMNDKINEIKDKTTAKLTKKPNTEIKALQTEESANQIINLETDEGTKKLKVIEITED